MYKSREDLNRVIALRKPKRVIKAFYESYLTGNQYAVWERQRKLEYESLFPAFSLEDAEDGEGEPIVISTPIEYDPPAPSFLEWLKEEDESSNRLRLFVPDIFDATALVEKEVDKCELERHEVEDRVVIRLLMTLIQSLLDKEVIDSEDFSVEEKQLFQKVKAIHGRIF